MASDDRRLTSHRRQHVVDRKILRLGPLAAAPVVTEAGEAYRLETGPAQAQHEFRRTDKAVPLMGAARQPAEDIFGPDDRQRERASRR
jgi:hypothetical protein